MRADKHAMCVRCVVVQEGEARTVAAFVDNPYGCVGDLLAKKLRRDPFAVGPIHPSRCPAMKGLLMHCGTAPYPGRLPWAGLPAHDT